MLTSRGLAVSLTPGLRSGGEDSQIPEAGIVINLTYIRALRHSSQVRRSGMCLTAMKSTGCSSSVIGASPCRSPPSWLPRIDSGLIVPSSVEAGIHACMPRPRVWRDLFMSPIISVDVWLMSGVRPDITTLDSSGAHAFMSVVGRPARVLKQPDNRHRSTMPRAARCSTSNALPDITRQHRDR
jgi:hypothetical protein